MSKEHFTNKNLCRSGSCLCHFSDEMHQLPQVNISKWGYIPEETKNSNAPFTFYIFIYPLFLCYSFGFLGVFLIVLWQFFVPAVSKVVFILTIWLPSVNVCLCFTFKSPFRCLKERAKMLKLPYNIGLKLLIHILARTVLSTASNGNCHTWNAIDLH